MAQKVSVGARIPEEWVAEIDGLIARHFPHRTRSEWLAGIVENELLRQREGRSKDTRLDETLTLVREMHQVIMPKGITHAND